MAVKKETPHTQQKKSTDKRSTAEVRETVLPRTVHALSPTEQEAEIHRAIDKLDAVPEQIKEKIGKIKTMDPRNEALEHPAAPLLKYWADNGCPVDCGADWTEDMIVTGLMRGPHVSALNPLAITALRQETLDKIKNGYAKLVKWKDIKRNFPKQLKISPVAAIPHKSRLFRTILDLSFQLRYRKRKLESVNSATLLQAPYESMVQLGHCVERMVATLAEHCDPDKPFVFSKLDIKDGFWRMAVSDEDAWNFCYVMPTETPLTDPDEADIIVPNSLQMGWAESPTARDVIEKLLLQATLPEHPSEAQMLAQADTFGRIQAATTFTNVLEVFVDDFCAMTNNTNRDHLEHFSRAMLIGIHSVFPPPEVSGHHGEDPVSQKKLAEGEGTWSYEKEVLGWIMNGAAFTIQLPPKKCDKIADTIKTMVRKKGVLLNEFECIAGKLQHATFGVPGGRGLMSPIHRALHKRPQFVKMTKVLRATLKDWKVLIQQLAKFPTHVKLLMADHPDYIQYTDACGLGAGGIIVSGNKTIHPIVWQFEWPEEIKKELITDKNPEGSLTINDLELAGIVLGWLVLELAIEKLTHTHVGSFCDNTSAVSWATKGHTARSIPAARLLRFLCLRQRVRGVSSLTPVHLAGIPNELADISSRAFRTGKFFKAHQNLLDYFNTHFPLPQGKSWTEWYLPKSHSLRVISCLHGEHAQMESLIRLPKIKRSTGNSGAGTQPPATQTHTSTESERLNNPSSSLDSPQEFAWGLTAEETRSRFSQSLKHSRPSARPSNWLMNAVPSTKTRTHTLYPSHVASKVSDVKTRQ